MERCAGKPAFRSVMFFTCILLRGRPTYFVEKRLCCYRLSLARKHLRMRF